LLQLLESEDKKLITKIQRALDITKMVRDISERTIESDEEDGEEGEMEVVTLARRCVELLDQGKDSKKTFDQGEPKRTLMEG
jgi:vacuolar protein 8